ncbi:MAG: ImmA/IrrE family metallo-endopeptidase, partial [Terriglobia bacterium]
IALRSPKSSTGTDEKEIEANQFAAELLMPVDVLSRDILKLRGKMDVETAINKLASKYKVSVQAMTIRLTSLGVLP